MKRTRKALISILLAILMISNSIILALPTMTVYAAATDMDGSSNSIVNPPQSIAGKTEIATWSYGSAAQITAAAPSFQATSGYYQNTPDGTKSTLKLFKSNTQCTSGFGYSTSTISNNSYHGQADQGYWLIKTSTKGFKDLIFNFNSRSSGTGPRDFNTEWSTDGTNWNIFGNATASTGYTVKIETTNPAEHFGMVLPTGASNQDTLYIRMIQKSNMSEGGVNPVASGGTHGINNIQLYGSKDPLYSTPNVTASPGTSDAILDVTPITLSCADSAAQIYYTTDGTTPMIAVSGSAIAVSGSSIAVSGSAIAVSGSAILYTGPFTALSQGGFTANDPFVIKAIAVSPSHLPSDVQTFSYTQQSVISNSDAKTLPANTYVWVKGVGTYLNGNTTLYIQDGMSPGSGLCIYKSGANFSSYVGKEIYVHGKTSLYNGLMEIVPDTVDTANVIVRNETPTLPTPTKIMLSQLSDRTFEGMLVSLDAIKLNTVAGTTTSTYYNHTISQGGAPCVLRAKGIATTVGTTGSYVNITKAIANYNSGTPYNGTYLFSSNTAELVHTATPTVNFIMASVASGTSVPLNSVVTLSTATNGAAITYRLNGGSPVTSTGNSVDVTVTAFTSNVATITATASDGSYTTAPQTFTYTQSQVADVTASPTSLSISATTPIVLATATTGAQIVYSLYKNSYSDTDGVLVGTADQVYSKPITVDASFFPIRIVAKATLANYLDSKYSTFKYKAAKATGGEKNYYGSIHAHTAENSDGQGTLAEADAYARDVGKFDFFILTDHSNSFDKAPASDTLATIKDLNSYNTTNQQWINGKTEAAKATTDKFLCDYGYEMTWSGGPGHMNTFNTAGFVSRNNTLLNNKTNDAGMQAYYQLLKDTPGSITQFNHPGATFGNFSDFAYYDPAIDARVNLVEVGNGEGAVGSGGYFPSIDQYILALDKGWHLAPTNNGDNHKKGWGTSNTCATVVYTNDFTLSGIYQAMQDRSVWATENRDLDVTYHLTDGTNTYSMGAILDAPPAKVDITITAKNKNTAAPTSNISSIQLIGNGGKVVNKQTYDAGSSDITYTYSMTAPQAGYYFAIITDNQGFHAVTAPIWLGSAPKAGITSVVNSTIMPVTTEALSLTTTLFNNESAPVTLKSISYTVEGDAAAGGTFTPGTNIASLGNATHVFHYTPATPGTKTITISAVITVGGADITCSTTTTMKVLDINSVSYVGLDASHGNEYVSGGSYPNTMANMMTLAAKNGLRVVQLNSSEDLINACSNPKYKIIILNAPSRKSVAAWNNPTNYSANEIAALKTFSENGNTLVFGTIADYAESSNKDSVTPPKHMSELQNSVLAAIGSTLREGDDEVMDDATNGGQPYRLYPTEFNLSNPLLQGVVSGQTYSQYSGATIYAVDPVTGERTTTLPSTVSALVYGFPTTYSAECDNDNFGYGTTKPTFPYVTVGSNKTDKGLMNADGIYIPKYVNPNSNIAVKPEEKLLAASEYVQHSNGKASLVVVAGGSFMSNFEIAVTMENTATLPYVNYNLMDNIYKTANPETITSIADAKELADGTEVILEGTATSGVNTQNVDANTNKGFFDCIYAQDSTGGINLFPVASGIEEGQKARFYGRITHYQGEIELTVTKFKVIDQTIHKITPTTMTTKVSMSPVNTGALVKTSGVVSNVLKDADGTINQFTLDDGSGPAIIFINGYITKGTTLPFIKNGAKVSVTGLASIGEVVSDSDMHARIRVRDRAEIVDLTAGTKTITIFHTNDMHGRLLDVYNTSTPKTLTTIGSDYVAAIKKSVQGSILIDAGDATQGLPFSTISKGADVIKMMNVAGYDGMVAGNHEFDYGQEALIANAELATFPVISANAMKSSKPLLANINGSNGADFIKEVNGIKIGFFGITTQETEYKTNPANIKGISFADPIVTAQAEVDKLKAQGAKVIVGILHIGNDSSSTITSSDIAKNVTGIDVIIDGHSHTIENNTVSNTLIAQTGSNSTNVGKIEIVMDSKGIVSKASSLLSAKYVQDNYSKDTEVAALANQINASQQPIFEKVVGYTDTTLWGGTVNGQSVGRLTETNLGDLVADAMCAFATSQLEGTPYQNIPVISLENGGGIRDTIPAGNITQGQVITILPFGNILSIKEANPKILYQVFENGFSKITGQNQSTGVITGADGRFPQIAGARVEYDPTLPSGERVKAIYLKGSNTALDKNDTTTKIILASNDFEVAGGDGYTMLSALKNIGEGNALDVIVAQYMTKLTQQGGGHFSYPPNDNRVKVVSSYVYTPYKTAITVSKASGILANSRVRYRMDNGTLHSATTDANGVLTIADIPSGVHSVRISNNDITGDIYINDMIGAGTYTKVTANLITPIDMKEAAANAVNTAIENLPGANMVQLTDDASINAANKAYNALTLAQKNYITSENAQKLADAMAKLAQLKNSNSGGNTSGGNASAAEKAAAEKAAAEKAAAEKAAADKAAAEKAADKSTVKIDLSKEDFSDVSKPKTIAIKSDEIFTELKNKDTQKVNVSLSLPKNAIRNTELDLVLKADVFSTLKETGKDLTVSVKDDKDKELYAWTFDKDELNHSRQKIADVNLSLKVSSIDTNSELSDMLKQKSEKGLIISFSNDGVLPAKASVRVYVGDQEGIKPGNSIYLYHYDKETGKLLTLPYSSNYMVDQDGYITIDILHCSEYVILKERAAASLVTPLIDQISVTAKKSTLHIGTKPSVTTMAVILPSTLELVKSMKNKTSQSGIGGVTAAFQSTNSKVAVIDKNGKITAKSVGKATILTTITLYNGNTKVIKTNITVKP